MFEKSAVSFSVTMINRDSQKKETARQKADVLYSKGRYRVTAGNQTLYSDGSSVWQWDKSTNEVTINTVAQGGDAADIFAFRLGVVARQPRAVMTF